MLRAMRYAANDVHRGGGQHGRRRWSTAPVPRYRICPEEDQERRRCAAPLARPPPGSAFGDARPARARRRRSAPADQPRSPATAPVLHGAVFLAARLSSSRPPRQGRPPGVARDGFASLDPAPTRKDSALTTKTEKSGKASHTAASKRQPLGGLCST